MTSGIEINGLDITQPHTDWVGKCSPPPKSKSAIFWKAYHIADDDRNAPGKIYAVCNLCGHVLVCHNSGTSNLRRHVQTHHATFYDGLLELEKREQAPRPTRGNGKKRKPPEPSTVTNGSHSDKRQRGGHRYSAAERAELAQAMLCISRNISFSELDHPAFASFVDSCIEVGKSGGKFVASSKRAEVKAIEAINHTQALVRSKLTKAKDLVLVMSIDPNSQNDGSNEPMAAALSVRWIENFVIRRCVLARISVPTNSTHATVFQAFQLDIESWGIQDKVAFLLHNFDLSDFEIRATMKVEVLGCVQKVLNGLIDPTVIGDKKEQFGGTVEKIRKFSRTINCKIEAGVREETSPDIFLTAKLDQNVSNSWKSVFQVVSTLLEQKSTIVLMDEAGQLGDMEASAKISIDVWEEIEILKTVLKPFTVAVKMLVENETATSSLVPFVQFVIHSELKQLVESKEIASRALKVVTSMMKDFETNWFGVDPNVTTPSQKNEVLGIHNITLLAHALDPRFKQLKVLRNKDDRNRAQQMILNEMVKLGLEQDESPTSDVNASSKDDCGNSSQERDEDIFGQYAGILENSLGFLANAPESQWKEKCENELKLYMAESTKGMRTVNGRENPLAWWKTHQVSFPTLWKLAKKYLAIPATAYTPESVNRKTCDSSSNSIDFPEGSKFLLDNPDLVNEIIEGVDIAL